MDDRELETTMISMTSWPHHSGPERSADDKAEKKRAEEAKLAAARYDAYGELARALWGDPK